MPTVGSVCSGFGGLDLGFEWAGCEIIWQAETAHFANRLLKQHWPDVPNLGNIKEIDWNNVKRPDILIGGYPCQPFSYAGPRAGKDDPRHLWPECLKAIRILRPDYAVFENVQGHLTLGFSTVLRDLAASGYDAEWQTIPASAVGSPQKRNRLIIVAYPDRTSGEHCGSSEIATTQDGSRNEVFEPTRTSGCLNNRQGWAPEPAVDRVANGFSYRVDRLTGLANAVVPQVGQLAAELIIERERKTNGNW